MERCCLINDWINQIVWLSFNIISKNKVKKQNTTSILYYFFQTENYFSERISQEFYFMSLNLGDCDIRLLIYGLLKVKIFDFTGLIFGI